MPDLVFRSGYAADAVAVAALFDLLTEVFGIDLAPLGRLGGPDPSLMPFSWFEGATCVANVSAFAMPMQLDGRRVDAWAIQSVATRPDRRGRGLYRDLMTRALAWLDARTPLVVLATETPALYRPFGFRDIVEHSFAGPPPPSDPRPQPPPEPLSLADPGDVAGLRALLARRVPVSRLAGLWDQATMFLLNAAVGDDVSLTRLPGLDAVVATETADPGTLRLLDVVAGDMPTLADLLAGLRLAPQRIEVMFTPDLLAWTPTENPFEDSGYLVRGPFLPPGTKAMFSPLAAF